MAKRHFVVLLILVVSSWRWASLEANTVVMSMNEACRNAGSVVVGSLTAVDPWACTYSDSSGEYVDMYYYDFGVIRVERVLNGAAGLDSVDVVRFAHMKLGHPDVVFTKQPPRQPFYEDQHGIWFVYGPNKICEGGHDFFFAPIDSLAAVMKYLTSSEEN